ELETIPAYAREAAQVIEMPVELTIEQEAEPTEPTAEPEPQPSLALADEAPDNPQAELRWLAWKSGYTDEQLLKWLRKRYDIDEVNINQAVMSLGDGELEQAITLFRNHLLAKEAA